MERTTPAALSTSKLFVIGMATLAVHRLGKWVIGLDYNLFADPYDLSKLALSFTLWIVPFAVIAWATARLTLSTSR